MVRYVQPTLTKNCPCIALLKGGYALREFLQWISHASFKHLFLSLFLYAIAAPTFACSRPPPAPTEAELFARADAVFVARITHTEAKILQAPRGGKLHDIPIVEARFELLESIKGSPPPDGIVREPVFGIGNCTLGLLAGVTYVLYTREEQKNFVLWISGSRALLNPEAVNTRALLDELRQLANPTQ